MGYSGARGTLIYEKNLKAKISCQTPFNYHIYSEFRRTSKTFEGSLPKNILEKNIVFWKRVSKYGRLTVQSTTVYVLASELGPPTPSPACECAPSPRNQRGGWRTFACGWGSGGVPIPTTWSKSLALYLLCGFNTLRKIYCSESSTKNQKYGEIFYFMLICAHLQDKNTHISWSFRKSK
jgi:hypothetical protein